MCALLSLGAVLGASRKYEEGMFLTVYRQRGNRPKPDNTGNIRIM